MPYPVMNTLLDEGYPKGALNYWLSSFTTGLSDALIDTAIQRFETIPSPMSAILFEHFHGQVTRIDPTATAVPHRYKGWNLLLPSEWITRLTPSRTSPGRRRLRGHERAPGHRAVAELPGRRPGGRGDPGRLRPELRSSARVKRQYDPGNVFHLNHNIVP